MEIPHLISYLKEDEITPTQTLCAGGTQEFRSKIATIVICMEEHDNNVIISIDLTSGHFTCSEHDRETTKIQVQNLKKSEALISQDGG